MFDINFFNKTANIMSMAFTLQEEERGEVTYTCSNAQRKVKTGDLYGIQVPRNYTEESISKYPVRWGIVFKIRETIHDRIHKY